MVAGGGVPAVTVGKETGKETKSRVVGCVPGSPPGLNYRSREMGEQ